MKGWNNCIFAWWSDMDSYHSDEVELNGVQEIRVTTPQKRLTSVRKVAIRKGILSQDVDEGAPCLNCSTCTGFRLHPWRRVCNDCKCSREEHDVGEDEFSDVPHIHHLSLKDDNENEHQSEDEKILSSYAWVPPGLDAQLVEVYMTSLPRDKVPCFENSEGMRYRNRQLMMQFPLQDSASENCRHLTEEAKVLHNEFCSSRENEMGTGHVEQAFRAKTCRGCNDDIIYGQVYVIAINIGEEAVWHPPCFKCSTCSELLADLMYYHRDGQVYCGRHHAELIKPRCTSCDELIFATEFAKAGGKSYHMDHFCCWLCDASLSGQQHLIEDDHPICISCYNNKFANVCHKCQKRIAIDEKDVLYNEQHWHNSCLVCSVCQDPLSDKSFLSKEDENFICVDCHKLTDTRKCRKCGEGFDPGVKRLELKGVYWHESCFLCDICQLPISSLRFIQQGDLAICCNCYEDNYVKKCAGCDKPLTDGGVSYNNKSYHRDCFCCSKCQQSIASQAFSVKDGNCYCTDCYTNLFAKRCSACKQFVLQGEYYTLDDDHWHKECFKCVKCDQPLAESTFIQEDNEIKLMCESCMA